MSATLRLPTATSALKKKFPDEWRIFEKMVGEKARNARLPLPASLRKELKAEAKQLTGGFEVEAPATVKRPFVIRALLVWEEEDYCTVDRLSIQARPSATKEEKALVRMLQEAYDQHGDLGGEWDLSEEAMESKPVKELEARIEAFCNRCEKLEYDYDFTLDDLLYK